MTETIITRSVPFDLTDAEVALKAKLYADGMSKCESMLTLIKAKAKHDTEEVAEEQRALLLLREQCSSRKEGRIVDCYREPDMGARIWRIKRCDTNEVVDTQKMTAEEVADMRQLDLIDELASNTALAAEPDGNADVANDDNSEDEAA